jgi:hypothetical protein
MKNQFESSRLDREFSDLNTDIVWKNANNHELKNKLVSDINKLSFRSKLNKFVGSSLRLGAVTAVLMITFVLVKQDGFNHQSSTGSNHNATTNTADITVQNQDVSVVFSKEDQELLNVVDGTKMISLTSEAKIPYHLHGIFPSVDGDPAVNATKEDNRVLVSVTYPKIGAKKLSITTAINRQESIQIAYDSLVKRFSSIESEVAIGNYPALLLKHQIILVTDDYIYHISGAESKADLMKIAESIQFDHSN